MRHARPAISIALLLLTAQTARAQFDYRFTLIADNSVTYDGLPLLSSFDGLSINDAGHVAFLGSTSAVSGGLFVDTGAENLTLIDGPGVAAFGGGGFADGNLAYYLPGSIYCAANGSPLAVASPDETFASLNGRPDINAAGLTAFHALHTDGSKGIWTGDGSSLTPRVNTASSLGGLLTDLASTPSINGTAQIAFAARYADNTAAVYRSNADGTFTLIADTNSESDKFTTTAFDGPSINRFGQVAFVAGLSGPPQNGGVGVFIGDGSGTTTIADLANTQGGIFTFFDSQPRLSAYGRVAFQAGLDSGQIAIVSGDDGTLDFVLQTGEVLDGAAVLDLSGGARKSLNDNGQLAIWANLAGRGGSVWRADPLNTTPDLMDVYLRGGLAFLDGAEIEFDAVTGEGFTRMFHRESPAGEIPEFEALGVYYEIITDADFTGEFDLTIRYDEAILPAEDEEATLALYRYDDNTGQWQRTWGPDHWLDTELNLIGGRFEDMGYFVIAVPEPGTLLLLAMAAMLRPRRRRGPVG